ncbi:MFS transporter [Lentzea sp. HUAS TT2]|uniref:MFS transporter n=1 Tax=Lentzea sp. HUAS TT2 TaxID=3447454 RepID=UPI003F6EEDAA
MAVRRILLYQAFTNLSLFMPVWIFFMQVVHELTLTEITVMLGISWLVTALAEVPAGAVADTVGRKASLALGSVLVAAGTALVTFASGYGWVLASYLVWSVGLALQSGADHALLYDSLVQEGRQDEYHAVASKSFAVVQLAQGVSAVAGGWLAGISLPLPMLATSVFTALSLVFLVGLREPAAEKAEKAGYRATLAQATSFVGSHPPVRYLMIYTSLVAAAVWVVVFVLFQPYLGTHQVPVAWFGALFLAIRLASVAGSRLSPHLVRVADASRWLLAAPLAFTALLLVVALAGSWWWLGVAMMAVLSFGQGVFRPLLALLLNEQASAAVRATLLSLQSLVYTIVIATLQPLAGVLGDHWGVAASFAALACVTTGAAAVRLAWSARAVRTAST